MPPARVKGVLPDGHAAAPDGHKAKPFRFPVQWVNRPNQDFRGLSGTVASGVVRRGDSVVVAASGQRTAVTRIVTADGDLEEARAGDAVTLTLSDHIDVARGDLLANPDSLPRSATSFLRTCCG